MSVAVRTWLYLEARACLPVGVPVGASAHTSASPGKPQAPCHPRAARGPAARHREASDGNGAFARDGVCDPRARDEDGRDHICDIAGIDQRDPVVPRVPAPGWQLALAGAGADHVREHVRAPGRSWRPDTWCRARNRADCCGFTGNTWYPPRSGPSPSGSRHLASTVAAPSITSAAPTRGSVDLAQRRSVAHRRLRPRS
jgi:hypothetical protein